MAKNTHSKTKQNSNSPISQVLRYIEEEREDASSKMSKAFGRIKDVIKDDKNSDDSSKLTQALDSIKKEIFSLKKATSLSFFPDPSATEALEKLKEVIEVIKDKINHDPKVENVASPHYLVVE